MKLSVNSTFTQNNKFVECKNKTENKSNNEKCFQQNAHNTFNSSPSQVSFSGKPLTKKAGLIGALMGLFGHTGCAVYGPTGGMVVRPVVPVMHTRPQVYAVPTCPPPVCDVVPTPFGLQYRCVPACPPPVVAQPIAPFFFYSPPLHHHHFHHR